MDRSDNPHVPATKSASEYLRFTPEKVKLIKDQVWHWKQKKNFRRKDRLNYLSCSQGLRSTGKRKKGI